MSQEREFQAEKTPRKALGRFRLGSLGATATGPMWLLSTERRGHEGDKTKGEVHIQDM